MTYSFLRRLWGRKDFCCLWGGKSHYFPLFPLLGDASWLTFFAFRPASNFKDNPYILSPASTHLSFGPLYWIFALRFPTHSGAQPGVRLSSHLASIAEDVGYGTHGYLISKRGAEKLLAIIEEEGLYRAIDCLMLDFIPPLKGFVCSPWVSWSQAFSEDSDIHKIKDTIYGKLYPRALRQVLRRVGEKICNVFSFLRRYTE